jgi:hypothetical protein
MPIFAILAGLLQLVPGVTQAVEAISRAARGGKPVKPIPFGREHFWDEVAVLDRPPSQVKCLYCLAVKTESNAHAPCPGPPKPIRRSL